MTVFTSQLHIVLVYIKQEKMCKEFEEFCKNQDDIETDFTFDSMSA